MKMKVPKPPGPEVMVPLFRIESLPDPRAAKFNSARPEFTTELSPLEKFRLPTNRPLLVKSTRPDAIDTVPSIVPAFSSRLLPAPRYMSP